MNKFKVYSDRGNERNVAKQVQFQWIRSVLEQTGIDWEDCFPESDDPGDHTILQKGKVRKILELNKIHVIDDSDDGVKIYITDEVIAEWKKPFFRMHYDAAQIDKTKKWYVEIEIVCWSVFDEEMEKEDE